MPDRSTRSGQDHAPRTSDPALVTWDTAYVSPRDRFSYFREGICRSFSPEKPQDSDVKARLEVFRMPHGHIGRLQTTPIRFYRSQADIAKIPTDNLVLNLQLRGGLDGQRFGQPFSTKAGKIGLGSTVDVLDYEIHDGGSDTLSLWFPPTALENCAKVGAPHPLSPACVESLRMFLLLINEQLRRASKEEMTHLFDATLSMLMAGLIKDRDFLEERCSEESAVRKGFLQTIQSFIVKEIANPHLSTGHAAARFGISPRYLQKLFASEGTTFKTSVTNARLDRIRADLLDVGLAHVPANDIAYRWGFRDITTFHRNFKSRFDDTPFQMRSFMASNQLRRIRRPS